MPITSWLTVFWVLDVTTVTVKFVLALKPKPVPITAALFTAEVKSAKGIDQLRRASALPPPSKSKEEPKVVFEADAVV